MDFDEKEGNLLNKLTEVLNGGQGNLKILEEKIDVDLQMEYFKLANELKQKNEDKSLFSLDDSFSFSSIESDDDLKDKLILVAQSGKPESYKLLEQIIPELKEDIKDWATLALQECRMVLESNYLDESQVFISTGLGGKNDKLRYFIVFIGDDIDRLTDFQKDIIQKEVKYHFAEETAVLEKLQFEESFAMLTALVSMDISLRDYFKELIANCNVYGNFLKDNFIITNVKELDLEEVKDFIEKN